VRLDDWVNRSAANFFAQLFVLQTSATFDLKVLRLALEMPTPTHDPDNVIGPSLMLVNSIAQGYWRSRRSDGYLLPQCGTLRATADRNGFISIAKWAKNPAGLKHVPPRK
jgi:hypothetical protein